MWQRDRGSFSVRNIFTSLETRQVACHVSHEWVSLFVTFSRLWWYKGHVFNNHQFMRISLSWMLMKILSAAPRQTAFTSFWTRFYLLSFWRAFCDVFHATLTNNLYASSWGFVEIFHSPFWLLRKFFFNFSSVVVSFWSAVMQSLWNNQIKIKLIIL